MASLQWFGDVNRADVQKLFSHLHLHIDNDVATTHKYC